MVSAVIVQTIGDQELSLNQRVLVSLGEDSNSINIYTEGKKKINIPLNIPLTFNDLIPRYIGRVWTIRNGDTSFTILSESPELPNIMNKIYHKDDN